MRAKKKPFVLVVENDRVVATTLVEVLRSSGYMAGIAESHTAALRIASRMVIDAAVIDVGVDAPLKVETAAVLQDQYQNCKVLLICGRSQLDEAMMLAEESGIGCEMLARPLSRAELLEKLATAPQVPRGRQAPAA